MMERIDEKKSTGAPDQLPGAIDKVQQDHRHRKKIISMEEIEKDIVQIKSYENGTVRRGKIEWTQDNIQ